MGKLLKFLAENEHHTPFEKSTLHFLVICDTASHIHLLKHRAGVSINGESARYREHTEDKHYVPGDWPEDIKDILAKYSELGYALYHDAIKQLVDSGLDRKRAKESARFFLPYSSQVTLDVAFNFRSFMHFYKLRAADDAQAEIREIAEQMVELVKETGDFDLSLEAYGIDL